MLHTLSIAALVTMLASAVAANELCPATENPVYDIAHLPYDCYSSFATCPTTLCSCVGMTYDATSKSCTGTTRRSEDMCSTVTTCLSAYMTCVNGEFANAEDSGYAANCTSDASTFTFFHSQALQSVVSPDLYNTTELFTSCDNFVCNVANGTGCPALNAYEICVPPGGVEIPITPVPGSTPAPTNPDGSYAVPTKIVRIVVTFTADFDSLVRTDTGKQKIKTVMTDALTKKLQYKTVTKSFKYVAANGDITTDYRKNFALAAGSLGVTAEATIPASDTSTLNSVLANVNSLKSDTSTSWYSGLSSACGCTIPPPTVSSSVVDGNVPQPPSSSSKACSSGCIAGVVVGGTAAVTIGVGSVAYISMKKSAAVAPDPTK